MLRPECDRRASIQPFAGPTLERSLVRTFEFDPADRLTLVRAPAGYGKTELLRQLCRRETEKGCATGWLEVRTEDRVPAAFAARLLARLDAEAHPDRQLAADGGSGILKRLLAAFRAATVSGRRTLSLFLDDAHGLNGSESIGLLQRLIEEAPPQVHFVLASRALVEIQVARLRAAGYVRELQAGQIGMDEAEAAALLCASCGSAPGAVRTLVEACEGWTAGLSLAGRLLAGRSPGSLAGGEVSGEIRQIAELFDEETLSPQPVELQEFLLQTSILDRLSAELCTAVTLNRNSRQMLQQCERRGLFIFPADDRDCWYRHHKMFAQFLRRRLRDEHADMLPMLHRRASDWFAAAGLYAEAVDHAVLAGEHRRAGEILDEHCTDAYGENLEQAVIGLAERIPSEVKRQHPRITLAVIWPLVFAWRFEQAERLLQTCRQQLDEIRAGGGLGRAELLELEHLFAHREMILSVYQDDMRRVIGTAERLAREYDSARPILKGSIYVSLIQAHCEEYRLREIERLEMTARRHLNQTSHPLAMVPIETVVGRARLLAARPSASVEPLEVQVALAERHSGGSKLGAMAAITLAEILYEQDRLDRAAELLQAHLQINPELGFVDAWIGGHITQARLLLARDGGWDAAIEHLVRASSAAAGSCFERIRLFFGVERLGLLLRSGRSAEARILAKDLGLAEAPVIPSRRVTMRDEIGARGWTHLAMFEGRHAEALRVARQWRSFTATAQAMRSAIHWDIVTALLLLREGDERAARRSLRQAVIEAGRGGCYRALLDEAGTIGRVLLAEPDLIAGSDGKVGAFGQTLIEKIKQAIGQSAGSPAMGATVDPAPVSGKLSAREIEMLHMVAAGLRNREIANRLAISESSVKWQLHQAYVKLGTDRRLHAIAKASQLGYIVVR